MKRRVIKKRRTRFWKHLRTMAKRRMGYSTRCWILVDVNSKMGLPIKYDITEVDLGIILKLKGF